MRGARPLRERRQGSPWVLPAVARPRPSKRALTRTKRRLSRRSLKKPAPKSKSSSRPRPGWATANFYGLQKEARLSRRTTALKEFTTQVEAGYFHKLAGPEWALRSRVRAIFGRKAQQHGFGVFALSACCPKGMRVIHV